MDFNFTAEENAFRAEVSDFIKKELPANIYAGDEPYSDDNFPATMEFRRKLGAKKWIGIGWAPEYGGLGASVIQQMIFHEEMIYAHGPLDPQAYQLGPALIAHGSDYLKSRFLAATANQEIVWAQGFSEPNAGSDLANVQTMATEDGDEYVINGQKIWTTYCHRADYVHILTRTDPNAPKHRGISYFILDVRQPGVTIQPIIDIRGEHHLNQVFFDNVRVPKENMIGEKNMGWYVAMTTLDNERSGIRDVARAARQWDDTTEALRQTRHIRGIRTDRVMVHKLAEMGLELEVSRKLSYRTGWMQQNNMGPNLEASMAKLFATELWQRMCRIGMEMLGLYSQARMGDRHTVLDGAMPEAYMGNIPSTIAAGSSEINRNIMATRGLGLPRGF